MDKKLLIICLAQLGSRHLQRIVNISRKTIEEMYYQNLFKPFLLKEGCWSGVNSIVLQEATISKNTVVGVGSIAIRDISPRIIYV